MPSDSAADDRPTRARRAQPEPKPEPDPDIWDDAEEDEPAPPRRTPTRQRPRRQDAEVIPTPYVKWVVGGTLAALLFVGVVIGGAALMLRRPDPVAVNNPPPVAFHAARPAEPPGELVAVPEGWQTVPPANLVAVPEGRREANPFPTSPPKPPPEPEADPLPEFAWPTPPGAPGTRTRLVKADSFPAGGHALEIAVAGDFLIARNSGSTLRAFDLKTKKLVATAEAQHKFISISASPYGGAAFGADYGGVQSGYDTPVGIHRLHRFDTKTRQWESRPAAGIVGYVRAVADDLVVTIDVGQRVRARLTRWEPAGGRLAELQVAEGFGAGYIDYDPASHTMFYADYKFGHCKVFALQFGPRVPVGEPRGFGTLVVAHGGERLYRGMDQFELADMARGTNSFKEPIVAATRDLAVAAGGNYYDAKTAKLAGKLPFAPDGPGAAGVLGRTNTYQVGLAGVAPVAVAPDGVAVWAYDPKADEFVRFDAITPSAAVLKAEAEAAAIAQAIAAEDASPKVKLPEFRWPAVPGKPGSQTRLTRAAESKPIGIVKQILVTPDGKMLFARTGRAIHVIFMDKWSLHTQLALTGFTDMSLSPDGQVLYAIDGHRECHLQRYDVGTRTWASPRAVSKTGGALVITASADDVLLGMEYPAKLSFNHWGRGRLVEIEPPPDRQFGFTSGEMVYDPAARRVIHAGVASSQGLHTFKLTPAGLDKDRAAADPLERPRSLVLAHGGERVYSGRRQLVAADIMQTTDTYPRPIVAATRDLAFAADGSYYNAQTAKFVGKLAFVPQTIAPDPSGTAIWAADARGAISKFTISGN